MKVKVYLIDKEDKPVFCGVFSEKQKARESDFIFIDRVLKEHEEDLFDEPIYETGIRHVATCEDRKSTFRKRTGEKLKSDPVTFGTSYSNKTSTVRIGVEIFREGWCLELNAPGGNHKFFHKINRRTVNTTDRLMSAHLYNTLTDVKRDLENKMATLEYCTNHLDWKIGVIAASEEFEKDYAASSHTKREIALMAEVRELISKINSHSN